MQQMAARSPTCNYSTLVVFTVCAYKNMGQVDLSAVCYPPESSSTGWKYAANSGTARTRTQW